MWLPVAMKMETSCVYLQEAGGPVSISYYTVLLQNMISVSEGNLESFFPLGFYITK